MPETQIQFEKIPWENRKEIGFLKALRLTRQEIIFHPVRFFSKVSADGGLADSLIFALLMVCSTALLAAAYSWFYSFWFYLPLESIVLIPSFIVFVSLLLLQSIRLLITAGIFHLGFLIAGARKGFKTTLKVIAYTSAWELFALLVCLLAFSFQFVTPALPDLLFKKILVFACFLLMAGGLLLLGIYPLILYFIGLKRAHNLGVIRTLCGFILLIALSLTAFMLRPKDSLRGVCPLRQSQTTQPTDNKTQNTKVVAEKLPETK